MNCSALEQATVQVLLAPAKPLSAIHHSDSSRHTAACDQNLPLLELLDSLRKPIGIDILEEPLLRASRLDEMPWVTIRDSPFLLQRSTAGFRGQSRHPWQDFEECER